MPKKPDLKLDAAALFKHLRDSGSDALEHHQRWCFYFRADDIEPLEELGQFMHDRLHEFFHVNLQDVVEEVKPDGSVTEGPPMLSIDYVGVLDEPTVAGLHKRFTAIAKERGLRYEGVASYTDMPFDLDIFDAAMEMEVD
jgi:hypothetical protein